MKRDPLGSRFAYSLPAAARHNRCIFLEPHVVSRRMNGHFIGLGTEEGRTKVRGDTEVRQGQRIDSPGRPPGGIYSGWVWDGTTLEAETDALGFSPLFYSATDSKIQVSTSLLRLLAEGTPAELDDDALGVFLRLGLFIGEETPYRHIRCLPPGGRLRWRAGEVQVSGAPRVPAQQNLSRSAALDGFIDLLSAAVSRTLGAVQGELVLPLSGGRDSRDLLLTLKKLGHPPALCVTYNSGFALEDTEVRAARGIAAATGVEHRILPTAESRIRDRLRTLALTQLLSDEHVQMIPLRDAAAGQDWTLLDGIGGDVLTRNKGFTDEAAHGDCVEGRWEAAADRLLRGHEKVIGHQPVALFSEEEAERRFPRDKAVSRVAAVLSTFSDAADPFSAFLFWTRTRREIALAPTCVISNARKVLCPYLDLELVDYLLSLPFEVTADARFHDEALERAHPEYAELPFDNDLEQSRGRPPLTQRLRAQFEGWNTLASLAPAALFKELSAWLDRSPARHSVERYRLYLMCVELARTPRAAARLLQLSN